MPDPAQPFTAPGINPEGWKPAGDTRRLFQSYSGQWRVEPCACGGSIAAPADDEESIRLAVQAHNAGTLHEAWRCWFLLRSSGEQPTAAMRRVDLSPTASRASAAAPSSEP